MLQPSPDSMTHIPVDRNTLLQMIHKAKQKQINTDTEWHQQKDEYIAGILATLERVAHSVTGDDIWNAAAPDGTVTIVIPPSSEKPPALIDWQKLERIYQLDQRETVLVPTKLLNILIEENDNE